MVDKFYLVKKKTERHRLDLFMVSATQFINQFINSIFLPLLANKEKTP